MFYEIHYSHFVENQNARNAKIRHTERNRTIEDLLAGKKTCPEGTIYQFGTLDGLALVEGKVNESKKAKIARPEQAQAAQWAIEQGYLKARADGSFKPDKGVAKWRVIRGYRAVTEP